MRYADFHGYTVFPDGVVHNKHGRPVRPDPIINRNGRTYFRYRLYVGKQLQRWYVHRLVAWCFLGPFPDADFKLLVVDHLNNDSRDNRLDNLEVVTQSENRRRSMAMENDRENDCPF